MGASTHIGWTDKTHNEWIGCTKVDGLCFHCYAETRDIRFAGGAHWGKGAPRHRTTESNRNQPRRWNREAEKLGTRYRVFSASLSDWLDDEVPIEWLATLLATVKECTFLDWQLLSKRPENWDLRLKAARDWHFEHGDRNVCDWITAWRLDGEAPAHVWIGTSVGDQRSAQLRIPPLLRIPAHIRFLSGEPLLGPVDCNISMPGGSDPYNSLRPYRPLNSAAPQQPRIHWVIAGGESGPGARPMHPDWARSLRDQCAAAGVPFFFKQWGNWSEPANGQEYDTSKGRMAKPAAFIVAPDGTVHCFQSEWTKGGVVMLEGNKLVTGNMLDGVRHEAFPEVVP